MNVIFRVDASSEMGHGHLMSCLALAQELSLQNVPIHLICLGNSGKALLKGLESSPSRKNIKHLDIASGQGFYHRQEL